jgi:hypothetical protein
MRSPSSLTLLGLIRRRPDLSLPRFLEHWGTIHRELARRLVDAQLLLQYRQNQRVPGLEVEGLVDVADGVAETVIADEGAAVRMGSSPVYLDGAYLDEPNFMQPADIFIGRKHLIQARSSPLSHACLKVMVFMRRAPGSTLETFRGAAQTESLILAGDAKPLRLTRLTTIQNDSGSIAIQPTAGRAAYDAVESSYWADVASFRAAWARRAVRQDVVDGGSLHGILAQEQPAITPH